MNGLVQDRVRHLLDLGRPRQALTELARAGAMASEDPAAWALVARAHLDLEEYEPALGAARQVCVHAPEEGYGFLLQAIVLNTQHRGREALQPSAEAVRLMPNTAAAHAHHGLAAAGAGRRHRVSAQAAARRAVELAPQDPGILTVAGLTWMRLRRRGQARRLFEQALAVQPDDSAALHNIGLLDAARGRFGAAGANLGQSSALDPTAPENLLGFRFMVHRWLWITHLALFAVAFLLAPSAMFAGWMRIPTLLILLALAGWAGVILTRSGLQVRRALGYALRGSWGLTVWFGAVTTTLVVLLLGQLTPTEGTIVSVVLARVLLVVGVIASWLAGRGTHHRH